MVKIPKAEFERAKLWRTKRNLTLAQLAALSGFSASAIIKFEQGMVGASQTMGAHPVTPRAWQRYKLICLAIESLSRAGRNIEDWTWQ